MPFQPSKPAERAAGQQAGGRAAVQSEASAVGRRATASPSMVAGGHLLDRAVRVADREDRGEPARRGADPRATGSTRRRTPPKRRSTACASALKALYDRYIELFQSARLRRARNARWLCSNTGNVAERGSRSLWASRRAVRGCRRSLHGPLSHPMQFASTPPPAAPGGWSAEDASLLEPHDLGSIPVDRAQRVARVDDDARLAEHARVVDLGVIRDDDDGVVRAVVGDDDALHVRAVAVDLRHVAILPVVDLRLARAGPVIVERGGLAGAVGDALFVGDAFDQDLGAVRRFLALVQGFDDERDDRVGHGAVDGVGQLDEARVLRTRSQLPRGSADRSGYGGRRGRGPDRTA